MGKHEKRQRKKKLKKRILGLKKQVEMHQKKIQTGKFRKDFSKDTTPRYWEKEIKNYERQKEELEKKLREKQKKTKPST
jgi:hypothetical protein